MYRAMFFARSGKLLGLISVADPVKQTSAEAIRRMRDAGIRTVLLTGDSRAAAEHIGSLVQVDEVIAEVLPEEKAGVVQRLQSQGRKVMMVGDGINDAPALTAADVGCAIGSGSDIAIESADLVLMKSDLNDVPRALRLSALTLRNIKQNLFWAFAFNTIGIPVAAGLLHIFGGPTLNPMEQERDLAYYLGLIAHAPSYQDLVFFRNRTFEAIAATLAPEEVETIKQAWTNRAKDETVPVVPPGQKRSETP